MCVIIVTGSRVAVLQNEALGGAGCRHSIRRKAGCLVSKLQLIDYSLQYLVHLVGTMQGLTARNEQPFSGFRTILSNRVEPHKPYLNCGCVLVGTTQRRGKSFTLSTICP